MCRRSVSYREQARSYTQVRCRLWELAGELYGLFRWRIEPGFQFGDLGFQALQASAGASQDDHLAIEFFPADQVQFAEAALQQSLELAFDFVAWQRRVAAEQAGGVAAQGVEEVFGREHGKGPENNGGQCITQCL